MLQPQVLRARSNSFMLLTTQYDDKQLSVDKKIRLCYNPCASVLLTTREPLSIATMLGAMFHAVQSTSTFHLTVHII